MNPKTLKKKEARILEFAYLLPTHKWKPILECVNDGEKIWVIVDHNCRKTMQVKKEKKRKEKKKRKKRKAFISSLLLKFSKASKTLRELLTHISD